MDKEKDKSYESISVTPVIKDIETLVARLFQFLRSILNEVYRAFTALLEISVKNIRAISVIVLLSGIVGYMSIHVFPRSYRSFVILTPILGNSDQLYTDVEFFQSLVKNQNWEELSAILNIPVEKAEQLKEFEINPSGSDLDKIRSLSEIYNSVDSVTWSFIDFDGLMESETPKLYANHAITIHSTDPRIFEQIETNLLNYLERPEHLKKSSANEKRALLERTEVLENRIKDLKQLQEMYSKVLLLQAEKKESNTVTNFSMGSESKSQDQMLISLFEKYDQYQGELDYINKKLLLIENYYKVIAKLNPEGRKEYLGAKGRAVVLGFFSYVLCLVFFSVKRVYDNNL